MKVFISYNHKDQSAALQIKERLAAAGFEVVIDIDKMKSGEDIRQFILNCIRESGITLSLVSTNSLMSAWVTMETMMSDASVGLRSSQFIPCYIDGAFFDRAFTGQAMKQIEQEIAEIGSLMTTALSKDWGIEDLQAERSRYLKMKSALPEIIGRLRDTKCMDLTPEHFDANMQKVVADLKASENVAVA